MAAEAERDYFSDRSVLLDPYDYFEELRGRGPVCRMQSRDVVLVTGFAEATEVLLNTSDYSSVICTGGPTLDLPFTPEGDDISDQIERHRADFFLGDLVVAYDGEAHTASRSLLNPLFTPSRLKANERYMAELADRMVREVVAKGGCELVGEVAAAYVTLVVADLLGVPAEDREKFREVIDAGPPAGDMDAAGVPQASPALIFMAGFFVQYVQDRRANPRDDVLTELSTATFPDGSTPDMMEVVKMAMFLFAAGQDTSAKLLGNAMRKLADDPALQRRLRDDRSLIPAFLEEMLRMEGSTKATFRLAKRKTTLGGVDIPAGTKLVIAFAAANRDPLRWEDPAGFRLDRPRIREHLAFGRGAHTCAGAPLARAEVRTILNSFLDHTSEISLSEEHHGSPGARRLDYEASYIIRGLERLHVVLKP